MHDNDLPLLYKWNADPEVLYWSDGYEVNAYSTETVHGIYGKSSRSGFCFVIEADGLSIGECWLCKMNYKHILELHPDTADVRRIDMVIGEKNYWNRGIGTTIVSMLTDFAFNGEYSDVVYGMVFDFNGRSRRVFEKCGFRFFIQIPFEEPSERVKDEIFLHITRQEFIERRRVRVPAEKQFMFPIAGLQPSQLYISEGKLRLVRDWLNSDNTDDFDPIPIKKFNGNILMTDGHTRVVAAHLAGWDSVPVYWDEDELDMRAYAMDVKWCGDEGIRNPIDLAGRIVPHKDYERLWRKRCMEMIL